jgi:serine/threonine protein kinase
MRLLSSNSGFGLVYEAYQQDIPKILKVLKPDRSTNPKVLSLFRKEADVLSHLNHPGVPLVESDGYFTYRPQNSEAPLHCIVMEKIEGPNLFQWMHQQGHNPIGERQAFQWMFQLTEILRLVHQQNYFHRDIKPENVMLRGTGQLVLVDFGAAREMSQTYLAQVGSLGVTSISSAGYTPPEQEQGQAVPQSDFYALGRTIVYLLTGRSPSDRSLYDPMLNSFDWRPHAPHISSELADLLDSLIAPRVIDRPKTAQEILDRLQQLSLNQFVSQGDGNPLLAETSMPIEGTSQLNHLRGVDHLATHPPPLTSAPQKQSASVTYWTWLIAGGVTLAAIVLIGVAWWGRQRSPEPAPPPEMTSPVEPDAAALKPEISAQRLRTFPAHESSINALKLMSDRRRFLSASGDNSIRLWDVSTGQELQTLMGHDSFVNAIALSPDEKTIYSGSADGSIFIWDSTTGEKQGEFSGHTAPVNALDRNPGGQLLVSGGGDGSIYVWDTQTQERVANLEGHTGAVNTLVVTDDGQWVISGSADRTIRLWNLPNGEPIEVLEGHTSYINAIAVSPDGHYLFSASADQTLKRWDLRIRQELETLSGHTSFVNVLTISRDGQTLSSGSADETVRQWDVATGDLRAIYTGFEMPVDHIIWPTEEQLVTASGETPAIKAWTVEP